MPLPDWNTAAAMPHQPVDLRQLREVLASALSRVDRPPSLTDPPSGSVGGGQANRLAPTR